MRFLFVLLVLMTAAFVQAADDPVGDWIWTGTEISYGVIVPSEEAGYTMRWVLTSDREFRKFRDGLMEESGTYEYFDDTVVVPPDNVWNIQALRVVTGDQEVVYGYEMPDENHLKIYVGTNGLMPDYPAEHFVLSGTVTTDASTWCEVKTLFR